MSRVLHRVLLLRSSSRGFVWMFIGFVLLGLVLLSIAVSPSTQPKPSAELQPRPRITARK